MSMRMVKDVMNYNGVKGTTKFVLTIYCWHACDEGKLAGVGWPSVGKIAKIIGIDPRNVAPHITKLKEMGVLEFFGFGFRKVVMYKINLGVAADCTTDTSIIGVANGTHDTGVSGGEDLTPDAGITSDADIIGTSDAGIGGMYDAGIRQTVTNQQSNQQCGAVVPLRERSPEYKAEMELPAFLDRRGGLKKDAALDAPLSSPIGPKAEAIKIIGAFDGERVRFFGPNQARPYPQANDIVFAQRWIEAGADVELCTAVFTTGMGRKKDQGEQPIGTLSYFNQQIANALAAKDQPMAAGQAGGGNSTSRGGTALDDAFNKMKEGP